MDNSLNKYHTFTQMLVDCFIFYNEIDLLKYRLNVLKDVVDFFVLVESTHTFSGKEKPLYYKENEAMFAEFKDKIIHIVVDMPHKFPVSASNHWTNEHHQRNSIQLGLENLSLADDDIIIIADVDEIPDPNTLTELKGVDFDIASLCMDFYYYNLNARFDTNWFHAKILKYSKYKSMNTTCDTIRHTRCNFITKGGWHLSYFGDAKFIQNKIRNFSHQEFNNENFTTLEKIEKRITNFGDLFDRSGSDLRKAPINENKYLPPLYKEFLGNFIVEELKV
jgi:beta-1,4-mannosyl-glycoprotein beta-1,4-N-acetylglucosaminyltransferase